MRLVILLVAILAFATQAQAQTCKVQPQDIAIQLKATVGNPVITTSSRIVSKTERVHRYVLSYADGSIIVLEQQDCIDSNLRLTLLSLAAQPSLLELNRLSAILALTPVWRTYFVGMDPATLLQAEISGPLFQTKFNESSNFAYPADDRIFAPSTPSNASIGYVRGNPTTQFRGQLTLSIHVKGS